MVGAEEAEAEAEKVVDGFSDNDRAKMAESSAVSYTHLTLPTKLEV